MARDDDPRFLGARLFGDTQSFACAPLVNTPASIDTFLGLTPGTTAHGAPGCYALTGRWYGQTQPEVQRQIDALAALAGVSGPLGYPTGDRFPDDYRWAPRYCYFLPAEFVPSSIAPYAGNTYTATFRIVFRMTPQAP